MTRSTLPDELGLGTEQRQQPAKRLSILIINKDLPRFPGGIAVEYLNTIGLASQAEAVGLVSMIHTAADRRAAEELARRNVKLYLWESPAAQTTGPTPARRGWRAVLDRWRVEAGLRLRAWPRRPHEAALADLEFRNMADAVRKALAERAWDVLVVVQTSQAAAVDRLPRFPLSVLVAHDIRSQVFARRAAVQQNWFGRRAAKVQARRYFAFEAAHADRYDLWVAVSEADARWIGEHYRPRRVMASPLPLDTTYFAPLAGLAEVPHRILFTGLMNHPPNVDAAVFFARQVFPEVRTAIPQAEFWIVGRNPTEEVAALASIPGVVVRGEVPDTRPYFASAAVVVVPLRFASGSRYKILEAWAMQKCVISTTIGAEGLDYRDGVNLLIADDAKTMVCTLVRALKEPALRDSVRRAGRDIACRKHDPELVAHNLYLGLRRLAEEKAADGPMRVCFDLRWMLPGLPGGLENLARSFLRELIALDGFNRYTLLLPARCRYDFDLRGRPNFRVCSTDSLGAAFERLGWRLRRGLHAALRLDHWESPAVRALQFLRSLDAELVYSFPGYIYPDLAGLRHVLQVPDIQHEYFPEFFSPATLEERRRLFNQAVRQAECVCAISQFTRACLIERLGVAPSKVVAVPLAADPAYRPEPSPSDPAVLRKYRLQERAFLLFPGHTWKHKNHRAAIEAVRLLRSKFGLTVPLVCTGGAREAQPALEKQIREAGLENLVFFPGYCPHEDMPALYRAAACLVFPSLFEGFGMPVLEAMASGCPVVCSNTTSLPEVAGDAALMVNPGDEEALADAIRSVLLSPDLRQELVRRGLERAKLFSWRRHVLQTLSVLRRVCGRGQASDVSGEAQ